MSSLIQRSLSGGELTPALWSRTDESKYQSGLKALRNAFVMKHGGAIGRGGTTFVAAAKIGNPPKPVRLIPFIFNNSDTLMLEFGNLYMRIHHFGSPITIAASAWSSSSSYVVGATVSTGGVNYYCILGNTNHSPPNATYWYPMTGNIFEVPTQYGYADLAAIDYVQSADVMTFAHASYPPTNLSRFAATIWVFSQISFAPSLSPPSGPPSVSGGDTSLPPVYYQITSVNPSTGEESIGGQGQGIAAGPSAAMPITVSWATVSGMTYNIYRGYAGCSVGFIGSAAANSSPSFTDVGAATDDTVTPPIANNPFAGTGNYPSTVAYVQQRLTFANSNNNPTTVWMSRVANFYNFSISNPSQADDSIQFKMVSQQVNPIAHLLEIGQPLIFTQSGEWLIQGDSSGVISPSTIGPLQQSYEGSAPQPRPLIVSGDAIFVQALGSIVRNLAFSFQRGKFDGDDLTIFSSHLFDGYTIVDWAYQKTPHSVIWVVRSDGALLSLSYIREQQILAWARHDFINDSHGSAQNVACIPEGSVDVIYVVVQRTIASVTMNYIERMTNPVITPLTNIVDYIGMDSACTYDGRNSTPGNYMAISGGTLWNETELLTLTASSFVFTTAYATNGDQIFLTGEDGFFCRFTIQNYVSTHVVTGFVDRTVAFSLQNIVTTVWTHAVSNVTGLDYLDQQEVSIFGDGNVVGSPNNPNYPVYTVMSGTLCPRLDKPYGVIHIGLPFASDIETLDIDTPNTETISDKMKMVGKVTLQVQNTRGLFVGPANPDGTNLTGSSLTNLTEISIRQSETYDQPVALQTGKIAVDIEPQWDSNGHVFIRQVDPLPFSVIGIVADGLFPFEGKY